MFRGTVDAGALERFEARLARYKPTRAQWNTLAEQLEKVVIEDNRKGVLSGLDRDGNPMAPVKYRTGLSVKTRFRRGPEFGTTSGRFQGRTGLGFKLRKWLGRAGGDTLPNNNLTTAAYRKLTGPPLAPRREGSRVITNFQVTSRVIEGGVEVAGSWKDVLSAKGRPFLMGHFTGAGRLPRRDLRGVRPEGRRLAARLVWEWFNWLTGGGG